jgi:hypothetical protein
MGSIIQTTFPRRTENSPPGRRVNYLLTRYLGRRRKSSQERSQAESPFSIFFLNSQPIDTHHNGNWEIRYTVRSNTSNVARPALPRQTSSSSLTASSSRVNLSIDALFAAGPSMANDEPCGRRHDASRSRHHRATSAGNACQQSVLFFMYSRNSS